MALSLFFAFGTRVNLAFAVLLIGSSALAQATSDNDAIVEQDGTDNVARIEQTGTFNSAGSDAEPHRQVGIFNDLDILQEGSNNRIGLVGPGLTQTGLENTETVFNQIIIQQTSKDNLVGSVTQTSEGSVANGANTLTIRQGRGGNNTVEVVRQIQEDGEAAQIATVEQSGQFNRVALIEQVANSNLQNDRNEVTLRITGQSNGITGLSGYAAQPSVTDSAIVQEGGSLDGRSNGNKVDMLITGDQNRFGIRQSGSRNDVGAVTINGDGNQLGLRQDGSDNNTTVTPIEGNDNILGIDQLGTNIVQVSLEAISAGSSVPLSDRNRILILQDGTNFFSLDLEGDDNEFTSNQDYLGANGGTNVARVRLIGSGNVGHLTQFGDNVFDLDIEGDDNNALSFEAAFETADQSAGIFIQEGLDNSASLTVSGGGNRFGAHQNGKYNSLIATIMGGQNQMALSQVGANNLMFSEQSGLDNQMTVEQN